MLPPSSASTPRPDGVVNLDAKVMIVTGASSGLGLATADALAKAGATVIMAVRDLERGERARSSLATGANTVVMRLDVANQASIEAFADEFLTRFDRLDRLVNNAGVMATPPSVTGDGIELQWATNHLGPFALTGLLLDRLVSTEASRVVAVASLAADHGLLDDHDPTTIDNYSRTGVYAETKLANLVFTVELNRRLQRAGAATIALAAHPGVTHTNLVANLKLPGIQQVLAGVSRLAAQPVAAGAEPIVRATIDPLAISNQYWGPSGWRQYRGSATTVAMPANALDPDRGQRLWQQSIELSGVDYLC
ncbi:MAG: SDR family NAD(P)-dependent oxidoreductase [Actinomycetia bacterium]|nr:SDR family NAD(P)-dependent oxidoreductase [Actinomycetes bacterium]